MPLQYKNTFLEYVPAVPELKRSKTSPDLIFTFQIEQKLASGRVDSDAETECRSSESTEDSLDSPALASQRKQITGPLWADMTDDDEELDAPVPAPAAEKASKTSWAEMSDEEELDAPAPAATAEAKTSWADMSDEDEVMADAAPASEEADGWTTVVSKKGKKSRR